MFFDKIFGKNKNTYKINANQEQSLVYMLIPKKQVKLKSKIVVPENFCAILLSKEKLLDLIPSGEYELNGFTIEKACKINNLDKSTKKGYKKTLNLDFYYVNLNVCKIKNEFKIKRKKTEVKFECDFKIINAYKFLRFLFNDRITFNEKFAHTHLTFGLSQLIYYYFFDNKVVETESLEKYIIKKLKNIGVECLNFDIEYFINEEEKPKKKKKTTTNEKAENPIDMPQNSGFGYAKELDAETVVNSQEINAFKPTSIVELNEIKTSNVEYFSCENCGAKLHKDSKVCYNCGKSFVEKNCCENCGREIKKGLYVCPYCKSVLFNN